MCVACHMCASDRNFIIPTPPTQPFPCVNVCKNSEFHRVVNDAGSKNIPIFLLETNTPFLTMDLAYLPTFYLHLLLKKPTFTYVYRKHAMDTMGTVPSLDSKQASRDLESPKRSAWQVVVGGFLFRYVENIPSDLPVWVPNGSVSGCQFTIP